MDGVPQFPSLVSQALTLLQNYDAACTDMNHACTGEQQPLQHSKCYHQQLQLACQAQAMFIF